MKYLLDTDHLSILQRQTGMPYVTLWGKLSSIPSSELACAIISFHEQTLGCYAYINKAGNQDAVILGYEMLAQVLQDFIVLPVLPFDTAALTAFDALRKQGARIATMDLRIAAIAVSRRMVLLPRNTRDFSKVPGLLFEDWTL